MNLFTNPWLLVGLVLIALTIGFGAGYKVEHWHTDAKALAQVKADAKQADMDAAATNRKNDQTAAGMAALLTSLQGQAHAFDLIDQDLASHSLGSCALSPDADRLYQRAYQAAFPGATNQAAGGHAANRPTGSARKPVGLHQ